MRPEDSSGDRRHPPEPAGQTWERGSAGSEDYWRKREESGSCGVQVEAAGCVAPAAADGRCTDCGILLFIRNKMEKWFIFTEVKHHEAAKKQQIFHWGSSCCSFIAG